MRSPQFPSRISKLRKGERPMLLSKLCGMRCPECGNLQIATHLSKTNPWRGWNKLEAHECGGCGSALYLTGEGRNRRFFFLNAPVFLLSALIGGEIVTKAEGLHHFHEARGHDEPNFLGFLILIAFFVFPCQFALSRFEKIAVFDASKDSV